MKDSKPFILIIVDNLVISPNNGEWARIVKRLATLNSRHTMNNVDKDKFIGQYLNYLSINL